MINAVEIDERISKCQKILDVDPNSQIFAALAEAYRKKGELDKAFRICQNGLKVHPSYGSAHVVMAKVNLDRGLYDWAEAEANKAAQIDGMTRTIELLLAEIFIYKGEFERAIKLLKKLCQADPNNGQISRLLEIAQRIPEEQTIINYGGSEDRSTATEAASEAIGADVVQATPEAVNAADVVARGIKIPGIDGVLFVNFEGLVVESEWTLKMDSSLCSATLGEIGNLVNQQLQRSSFGDLNTILIETVRVTFYLIRVHNGLFLFAANESANLGTLRMKIENLLVGYR